MSTKKKKNWMRSGNFYRDRSVKFPYRISQVAVVLVIINFIVTMIMGTTMFVDYVLMVVGISVCFLMTALYSREKSKKGSHYV